MGLSLSAFDLATNKVLALVGRAEPRDWVDTILCDQRLQPLGYLAWAAAGKDPGLNPTMILEEAARTGRYTEAELAIVEFEGERPTAAEMSVKWKAILQEAKQVVNTLPAAEVGKCVYQEKGRFVRLDADELVAALEAGLIRFHAGSLRGAFPAFA